MKNRKILLILLRTLGRTQVLVSSVWKISERGLRTGMHGIGIALGGTRDPTPSSLASESPAKCGLPNAQYCI